jgi:hypothetical protein
MTTPHKLFVAAAVLSASAWAGPAASQQDDRRPSSRPDFSGTWTLDRAISSDTSHLTFGPRSGQQQRPGYGGGGSGRRGGFGGFGGQPQPRNNPNANAAPQDPGLKALTDELRMGFSTIVISHHDPSFVVNDSQDHTQFFHTNDSPDQNYVGSATLTSMGFWEDDRLVIEYSLTDKQRLVYTYTLLQKTSQMVLRVRLEAGRTNSDEVRLVYNMTPAKS